MTTHHIPDRLQRRTRFTVRPDDPIPAKTYKKAMTAAHDGNTRPLGRAYAVDSKTSNETWIVVIEECRPWPDFQVIGSCNCPSDVTCSHLISAALLDSIDKRPGPADDGFDGPSGLAPHAGRQAPRATPTKPRRVSRVKTPFGSTGITFSTSTHEDF